MKTPFTFTGNLKKLINHLNYSFEFVRGVLSSWTVLSPLISLPTPLLMRDAGLGGCKYAGEAHPAKWGSRSPLRFLFPAPAFPQPPRLPLPAQPLSLDYHVSKLSRLLELRLLWTVGRSRKDIPFERMSYAISWFTFSPLLIETVNGFFF